MTEDEDFQFDDDEYDFYFGPDDEELDDDLDNSDDSELDDIMVIAVTADTETWLPQILLGIPIDPEIPFQVEGIAPVNLTPEEAYQVGAYLIQAAATVSSFYAELVEKTVEERKEIISLESHFLGSPFPI
jgi:hypothetical protein